MKRKLPQVGVLIALSALLLSPAMRADLVHRYSFSETSGTTVTDSIGTAHGTVKGNGAFFGGGVLDLPGGTPSNADEASIAGYVDLPNHIINVHTNLTIETWVQWYGVSGGWQRVFDLGISAGGEDVINGEGSYLFFSPNGDGTFRRFAVRDAAVGGEPVVLSVGGTMDIGVNVCMTVVYNYSDNVSRMYSNGVQIAEGPASVDFRTFNDVNNWLGRSQYAGDYMFGGNYDEFRIYSHALSAVDVAASYLSGPGTPSTAPAALGSLQAVHLSFTATALLEGDTVDARSTADFANMTGVLLAGVAGVTYESDNAAVATIDAKGHVVAVSQGSANLSVSYGGQTDTVQVVVSRRQAGLATAGALYVTLRAPDVSADVSTWVNRTAGLGDFYVDGAGGTPAYVADVEGTGLPGVKFTGAEAYVGPNTPADGDLTGASDCSIEVWALNPSIAAEETLVSWARRGGGDGSNMSFNYGSHVTWGAVGHWGGPDMGWSGAAPAPGKWHYLVYTYDGVQEKVYADGILKTTETQALAVHPDLPIRIAAQANTAGDGPDFGQALSGYIATVRIQGGALTANDIKNNFLYGMELSDPGTLVSVNVSLDVSPLVGVGARAQATATANYANRPNLGVDQFATFSSSDPAVATVDAKGVVIATGVGTAVITANYAGMNGTHNLQVLAKPATVLVHRYSFSDAVGSTTVADSKGTAHGTIKGTGATFDGAGRLTLPGGTASNADAATIAGYVDLPNGIISALTDATFEVWVNWAGAADSSWQRIFDFGTSDGGEDVSNGNGNYVFLTPRNGSGNARFGVRDPVTGLEPTLTDWAGMAPIGTEILMTVVYNQRENVTRFYSNAVEYATGPAGVRLLDIDDVNNWLGRAQWGDPMFNGTYNEFRIWDGALTAAEVLASYTAGPDNLPAVTKPSLAIVVAPAGLAISWPSSAAGFVLEAAPELLAAGTVWTTVDTSGAVDQGGQKTLTLPVATAGNKYYRLRQ